MGERPTVADSIVRRLAREGITDCFGVPGDFAFTLCDAVGRSEAFRWIGCSAVIVVPASFDKESTPILVRKAWIPGSRGENRCRIGPEQWPARRSQPDVPTSWTRRTRPTATRACAVVRC